MNERNNNLSVNYRYLSKADLKEAHRTFSDAFSDYLIPVQMTEEQFANHLSQNAVELKKSVGAFANEKMFGLTLNGFGLWNDVPTVYDAGTGVIPGFRNLGAAGGMFEFMMPDFRREGFRQILLEVITQNEKALGLYRKLGFETQRTLIFFERSRAFKTTSEWFKIREINYPDRELLKTFGNGQPSWQNTFESFDRSSAQKIMLGAFEKEKCIGYGTAYCNSGMIQQIAVAEPYRRVGAGRHILDGLQGKIGVDKNLKISNVDADLQNVAGFLQKCGFTEKLRQFEMLRIL